MAALIREVLHLLRLDGGRWRPPAEPMQRKETIEWFRSIALYGSSWKGSLSDLIGEEVN